MKITLEDSELAYVSNLLNSVAANTKSILETHQKVSALASKFEPPRSYVQLSTDERLGVKAILTSGLKAIEGQRAAFTDATPQDQRDHLERVAKLIDTVKTKLEGETKE